MARNDERNSYYKNLLIEYSQKLIEQKLQKEGKFIKNITPTYVIYARRSTKGKKRQERSLPDQISACQKLAADKKLNVVNVFQEKESAKKPEIRDVFYEMLAGIRKKQFNSIIAWHPDRLARNMKDAGTIIDLLDRNIIIDLQFPTYTFTRDANGLMALGIQFVMAKQYSDTLSVTSQRGTLRIANEGKAPNRTKYGYILNGQRYFRLDKHSFPLLKEAFRMALNHQPQEVIALYLNKNKFEYGGKITKMTKQKMSGIFGDPFYAGFLVYGDQLVDLVKVDPVFEPMITPLDFLQLRNIFDSKKGFKKIRTTEILLKELVNCHFCGNLMSPYKPQSSGKSKFRYLRLLCSNKNCVRYLEKRKNKKGMPKDIRAKVIFDFIIKALQGGLQVDKEGYDQYVIEAKRELTSNRVDYVQEIKNIARKLSEVQSDLDEKTKIIKVLNNQKLLDELNEQINKLMDEKSDLKEKQDNVRKKITDIDHGIQSDLITYDKLLNFFDNIVGIIQNSENRLLIDKVLRMMFLNFTVDYEKVASYQLNPSFEKYVKLPSVLPSRSGET